MSELIHVAITNDLLKRLEPIAKFYGKDAESLIQDVMEQYATDFDEDKRKGRIM